jgi:lipoprotein NlpI
MYTTISLLQGALQEEALKPEERAAYHYHLGLAYEKSNDLSQAKLHLRQALALDDKSARLNEYAKHWRLWVVKRNIGCTVF